jgi:serine/threonine-protein kinase
MLAGRYRLVERLGAGGMSVVWRAYDEVLGRAVAVKLLSSGYAADPVYRAGVHREARAAARLSHPNITNVYDYGEATSHEGSPVPFVVMELVEGRTLAARLASGPISWRGAVEIAAQVAGALAAAHVRGLVHRDVTPANIMLAPTGVKVVDFGISAVVGERDEPVVMGTPAYLAPERRAGAPVQPAADVYGLGVVLYQCLAGGLPPTPPRADVPPALVALVKRCMSADPTQRPTSESLARRLRDMISAPPVAAVPVPPNDLSPTRTAPVVRESTRVMPVVRERERERPRARPQQPFRQPRRGWLLPTVALLIVMGLLAWGAFSLSGGHGGPQLPWAAPASPKPKPSPTRDARGCAVTYKVTLDAAGYFVATVDMKNSGKVKIAGWTLEFDFPTDQHVSSGWNGRWHQIGTHVKVADLIYNRSIAVGDSVTVSFAGRYPGDQNNAPSRFSVNGVRCQVTPPT